MVEEREVEGLKELLEQLDRLPVNLERNVLRWALRKTMRDNVLEHVRAATPVRMSGWSAGAVGGALRRSVRLVSGRGKSSRMPQAMVVLGNEEAWYGHIVEKGTYRKPGGYDIRPRGAKSLFIAGLFRRHVRHPGIKPRWFFRNAVRATSGPAIDGFKRLLQKRLPKEFKKLVSSISRPGAAG